MNETVEYPYADLSGMVVVKNQSGQKLVLDVYGNEIISAGQYEDLAPARDGCVWAKQNGLWGLLQVYITMGFLVGSVMNTWLPLIIPPVNN